MSDDTKSSPIACLPQVLVKEGTAYTTSRNVAEVFGKEHRGVLRAIDTLLSEHGAILHDVYFQGVSEPHPTVPGRMIRSFHMSRDGLRPRFIRFVRAA